jgi:5-methylcytosine-specific restriction endonuclease McrA
MSKTYIPVAIRRRVAAQARYRCGYCLTQQKITGLILEFDHLTPKSLGGSTTEDNLWLACSNCNDSKNKRVTAKDPLTGEDIPIFNPRTQIWNEHFEWNETYDVIIGKTAIGRTTVKALNLNLPEMVSARKIWVEAGWHPAKD